MFELLRPTDLRNSPVRSDPPEDEPDPVGPPPEAPAPPSPLSGGAVPLERVEAQICELAGHLTAATCRFLVLLGDFDIRRGWASWEMSSCAACRQVSQVDDETARIRRRLTALGWMRHGSDGRVLDLGRRRRRPSAGLRRAAAERDKCRCRFPGCESRRVDLHHIQYWSHGGQTKLDNLISLCKHHHMLVHERGHVIAAAPGVGFSLLPRGRYGHPVLPAAAAP